METITTKKTSSVKQEMSDILLDISLAKISTKYFGKSRSWLYHKLDGVAGNGKPNSFSEEEKEILRGALNDLSERIRRASDNIK